MTVHSWYHHTEYHPSSIPLLKSTSLGKGEGVDEESNKKWHRKEGMQSKKVISLKQILLLFTFLVTPSLFLYSIAWPGSTGALTKIWHVFVARIFQVGMLLMMFMMFHLFPDSHIFSFFRRNRIFYDLSFFSENFLRKRCATVGSLSIRCSLQTLLLSHDFNRVLCFFSRF